MLPRLRFPFPLTIPFCGTHRRIHCATLPAIAQFLFPLPVPLLFSLKPLIYPMPHLTALPLAEDKSTKQTSSQNLLHLIQQHQTKLDTALQSSQPLHPPHRFIPAHVPRMRHHQVPVPLHFKTSPRPLRCLAHRKELYFRMWLHHAQNQTLVKFCPPRPCLHLHSRQCQNLHLLFGASHRHLATQPMPPPPNLCSLLCPSSALPSPALFHRPVSRPCRMRRSSLSSMARHPPFQPATQRCRTYVLVDS